MDRADDFHLRRNMINGTAIAVLFVFGGRIVVVDFDMPTTVAGKFMSHLSGHGSPVRMCRTCKRLGFIAIERLALPLDAVAALRATKPLTRDT